MFLESETETFKGRVQCKCLDLITFKANLDKLSNGKQLTLFRQLDCTPSHLMISLEELFNF